MPRSPALTTLGIEDLPPEHELADPMPAAHEVEAQVLPAPDQVAQLLLL